MSIGIDLRRAGRAALAAALTRTRAELLRVFAAYRDALGGTGLQVPCAPELNPPLWELGHIAWFEERWIARNPQRDAGVAADPAAMRLPSLLPQADAFYDSSTVAHDDRWRLPLPGVDATLDYLACVRERTLALLARADEDDASLYFFRLALFHEAMHREAWTYMAQSLGLPLPAAGVERGPMPLGTLELAGRSWSLGHAEAGFAFDNECPQQQVQVDAFTIDRAPLSWARYLPFVETGGYETAGYWTDEGWRWRCRSGQVMPRYLRRKGESWQRRNFSDWQDLELDRPAININCHEAQAWCAWAGRRLPTEAEWEVAACTAADGFAWGEVWEWTSSPFSPFPGFIAHPYRDYSQPWFGSRPVLRGASFATAECLRHPRYRNFFTAERNDILAGFRSCAG